MRLHGLLGEMSFDVDRIKWRFTTGLVERGAKLKGDAVFNKRLQETPPGKVEAMRKKDCGYDGRRRHHR